MKYDLIEEQIPGNARGNQSIRETLDRPAVLLAEDDHEMLQLLADALVGDGYRVIEAGSGLQMFDRLRHAKNSEKPPDLIVSDIRMPGLTGLEILKMIRDWGWTIPVILITAFGDQDTRSEAFQQGATAFFSKPFEIDDLRTAVTYFLQYHHDSSYTNNEPAAAGECTRNKSRV